jgi:hypothetical protein
MNYALLALLAALLLLLGCARAQVQCTDTQVTYALYCIHLFVVQNPAPIDFNT